MKTRNALKTKVAFGALAVTLSALVGCATQTVGTERGQASCEISLNAICAKAMENYLAEDAVRLAQAAPSKNPQVVPLVAPVTLPEGGLAAEVDCYVDTDSSGYWLVYAHLAIPPSSPQAVEHLSDRGLCTNGSPERRLAFRSTYNLQNVP